MRNLHPAGATEVLVDGGRFRRPDGVVETWTTHRSDDERQIIRVDAGDGTLWHLVLDVVGRPERLEARLTDPAAVPTGASGASPGVSDIACTFFEDEVLIWRRGAEPASEAIAVPPLYRLLWPPIAGRAECLRDAVADAPVDRPAAVMLFWLVRRPAAHGGLRGRPVKFTLRVEVADDGDARLAFLSTPGLADATATFDGDGRLVRWEEAGGIAEPVGEGLAGNAP